MGAWIGIVQKKGCGRLHAMAATWFERVTGNLAHMSCPILVEQELIILGM